MKISEKLQHCCVWASANKWNLRSVATDEQCPFVKNLSSEVLGFYSDWPRMGTLNDHPQWIFGIEFLSCTVAGWSLRRNVKLWYSISTENTWKHPRAFQVTLLLHPEFFVCVKRHTIRNENLFSISYINFSFLVCWTFWYIVYTVVFDSWSYLSLIDTFVGPSPQSVPPISLTFWQSCHCSPELLGQERSFLIFRLMPPCFSLQST